jgi:deoxyguanosine kinase
MKYRYIAIEGNIGSGKSTLARLLAKHYNAQLILEAFEQNDFLPRFYADPVRYALPLELSFLADRYKHLSQIITTEQNSQQNLIADYTFIKSKLFAQVNLDEAEYKLFLQYFDILSGSLPAPDLLIYLDAPLAKLRINIKNRGRDYEQDISDAYLASLQETYKEYLKHSSSKTLIIDISQTDFIYKPHDLDQLIDFINRK